MKVIVAGSRTITDYEHICGQLDLVLPKNCTIISGCARGVDTLGERYAEERGLPTIKMPADWQTHGKRAGYLRNEAMARIADAAVIFWDGKSRGTRNMIDIARRMGLKLTVVGCEYANEQMKLL